jgi:hypothetical protein
MKFGNCGYVCFGILAVAVFFNACFTPSAQCQETENSKTKASIEPLTKEQQEHLLKQRLNGGMGNTFRQFAHQFLVMSRIDLPYGVGLMASSKGIESKELQPVYPQFYKPTLREFLDVIALQTKSQWNYDPTSKYFHSEVETGPVKDLAIFEFKETEREKPYQVTLPRGWRSVDKGHWTMYVPPVFPIGMDIYELGTYSSDEKDEADLLKRVPNEVSWEWAKRAKDEIDPKEFTPAKVGPYSGLYFETMMPLRDGRTVRWRQWIFMVGNRCYGVVSTIFPQYEKEIFPDVQSMVASFSIKAP